VRHSPSRVALAFVLFATAAVAASPSSLSFTYTIGATPPPPQYLSLSGAGVYSASAASSGNWLTLTALTGPLPGLLGVTASPQGLSAGVYQGVISLAYQNSSPQAIPVTLVVTAAPPPPANSTQGLALSPSSLTFAYQSGAGNPQSQSLSVNGSARLPFTLIAISAGGWLTASPLSATVPAILTVSVNPAGLAAGTYSGAIIIEATTGASSTSQYVIVTLSVVGGTPVAPDTTGPPPRLTSIVNAASFLASPLAPGEIISIFGSALGPANQELLHLTPSNVVDSSLAGTRVIIDGKPAPVLFTQSGQVNTIVPYSAAGKATVPLQLEYQGVQTVAATLSVADAAPAIFTLDGTGRGPAAMLDEDTSVNSDLNPADRGSIAVLYATGAGVMTPSSEDGAIAGTNLAYPVQLVSVLVDGQDAKVLYAGSAPGEVAGVLQVNFRVPAQAKTGSAVGVLLKVGRFTSQSGVTFSIR
jgi:uncharacterized protein (TIGR03437 family)